MKRGKYGLGIHSRYHKLTNARVRDIRLLYSQGVSVTAIAKKHSISHKTVRDIASRHTWKHL